MLFFFERGRLFGAGAGGGSSSNLSISLSSFLMEVLVKN